jgi:hypothetical protein
VTQRTTQPSTIEVDVQRIAKLPPIKAGSQKASHRTYRVIVFSQESASGKIGLIDPEVEPPV